MRIGAPEKDFQEKELEIHRLMNTGIMVVQVQEEQIDIPWTL